MFLDYLISRENKLAERLDKKKKELFQVGVSIKENQRFTQLLEEEKSVPFTEFTPQVVTSQERKKQQELSAQGVNLERDRARIEREIQLTEAELKEIKDAISDAKARLMAEKEKLSKEKQEIIRRINKIIDSNLHDPMKTNIELKDLLKDLNSY